MALPSLSHVDTFDIYFLGVKKKPRDYVQTMWRRLKQNFFHLIS